MLVGTVNAGTHLEFLTRRNRPTTLTMLATEYHLNQMSISMDEAILEVNKRRAGRVQTPWITVQEL